MINNQKVALLHIKKQYERNIYIIVVLDAAQFDLKLSLGLID